MIQFLLSRRAYSSLFARFSPRYNFFFLPPSCLSYTLGPLTDSFILKVFFLFVVFFVRTKGLVMEIGDDLFSACTVSLFRGPLSIRALLFCSNKQRRRTTLCNGSSWLRSRCCCCMAVSRVTRVAYCPPLRSDIIKANAFGNS